jgi:carboxylesterase type B
MAPTGVSSDELYIPSDRPHLKHRRFHNAAGWYPEGLKSAETEEAWSHQVKDAARAHGVPAVLVPHALDVERNFEHLGWHSRWRDVNL